MSDFSNDVLTAPGKTSRIARYRPYWLILVPLLAILFQIGVPRVLPLLTYLSMPLLVTVYFALMLKQPILSSMTGAGIGMVEDALANQPIGIFGIVKTLVGYFAASISQRFDVGRGPVRFVLTFFFFFFSEFFNWVLSRSILGQVRPFDLPQTLIFGSFNALVSVPLFLILDKLRVKED